MVKEFFFSPPPGIDINLGDEFVDPATINNETFLVANSSSVEAEIYAPEINFYLHNSRLDARKKIADVKKLYEIRAIAFDQAQQTEFSIEVGKRVIIISAWDQSHLKEQLEQRGFVVMVVDSMQVLDVSRHENCLRITAQAENEQLVLEADQLLW